MARLRHGFGSMLSGKTDGMVFVQMNGETYMRVAPERSKGSWTPKQALHRERFKKVNSFCNQFKTSLIPLIWKPAAKRMAGHSLFLKTNMAAFGMDGHLADAKMLQLSVGKLPVPQQFKADRQAVDSSTIAASWNNDPYLDPQRLSDQLMVISGADGQFSYLTNTGLFRSTVNGTFELPSSPTPQAPCPMQIYLFFASEDKKDYTGSVCFEI